MKLHDPVTGEELVLYSSRGESNEVCRADEDSVISCLASEYGVNKEAAQHMLEMSDVDAPVVYHDQIFWVE